MSGSKTKPRPLTEKQRRFVEAFMGEACGIATEAARLAGYAGSENTLAKVGSENLRKPQVMAAIEALRRTHPLTLSREKAQEELWRVFMGKAEDWTSAVDQFGQPVGLMARDRLKAHTELAKTAGWNINRHEHSGPDGGPIETKAADVGPNPKDMTPEELAELEKLSAAWADFVERVEVRIESEKGE